MAKYLTRELPAVEIAWIRFAVFALIMQFYIDGAWVDPVVKKSTPVVNPATEEAMYEVALGSKADVDKAVAAARRAFETFSQTSREERVALLSRIIEVYKTRMEFANDNAKIWR